ncbi:hypothetical protein VISP3789_06405 [Vibrio splendidus ATCC 33789]|nr:hypothetical protein VISP3789_06405 [Vibrio splendidus ATCC 33789]
MGMRLEGMPCKSGEHWWATILQRLRDGQMKND